MTTGRKLALVPGTRLLDIGCGWGSLPLYAAQEHHVQVTAVTLAREQAVYVREQVRVRGLEHLVEVMCQGYRGITCSAFDAVAAVEMGEHAGDDECPAFAAVSVAVAVTVTTFGLSGGQEDPGRRALATALTRVWGLRLTIHIARRAGGHGEDPRYEAMPANRGRIMDRGPWRPTRHPNCFGDFCIRWGLFLVACGGGWQATAMSVISPLVMSVLLIHESGKRLLERHMAHRTGWDTYVAHTSGFFLRPPRSDR